MHRPRCRAHAAWAGREVHLLAVEQDPAGVDREVPGQRLDQGRLARAVVADERDDLAGGDLEVGAVEGLDVAEGPAEPAGLEDGAHDATSRHGRARPSMAARHSSSRRLPSPAR